MTVKPAANMVRSIEFSLPQGRKHKLMPKYYGKHPYPDLPRKLKMVIPGAVRKLTKRERLLKLSLKSGKLPPAEEFEHTIQVFAMRAMKTAEWLPVQRQVFCQRAKGWTREMLVQGMTPSKKTLQALMLACAATGDADGADWFMRHSTRQGWEDNRLALNAAAEAHGNSGQPAGVRKWIRLMKMKGFRPDAKTYAALIRAWEEVGNRESMLRAFLDMKDLEEKGELDPPLRETDWAGAYCAAARSYAKVGDCPRALAILKALQATGKPLTAEVHQLRLEAQLEIPEGPRRSELEIEKAFGDFVAARTPNKKLYDNHLAKAVREAIGEDKYQEALENAGTSEFSVMAVKSSDEMYNKALMQTHYANRKYERKGAKMLRKNWVFNKDESDWRERLRIDQEAKMGRISVGERTVADGAKLPEWMTLKKPETFGL